MMCNEPLLIINPEEILSKYNLTDKVEIYFQLLKKENRNLNLVSRETIESGLIELVAESIYPLEYIQNNNFDNYLDIGSGGGFPSIPIILTERVKKSNLVDRRQKKAGALRRMLLQMSYKSNIYTDTFEQIQFPVSFDLITMRLVKLNQKMLNQIMSLLNNNGTFIYYSTPEFNVSKLNYKLATYCYSTQTDNPSKSFTIFNN
ncbi:MAG: hypothetical protein DRP35_07995 [Candidatus Zixiibacteriota bacterium]|nr:MAG: hypothetical protein DRP35_07995 [candidate division Zixibacteria bacterium]